MSDLSPTSILIPSLNRPQLLRGLIENIHRVTPEPHALFFTVSDPESAVILTDLGEPYLFDAADPDRRYVTRMNKMVHQLPPAGTVFFGSDDVLFHEGWLSEALEVMRTGFAVVVGDDLRNPNGTMALMRTDWLDRAVFDSPGDAFHGGYIHNFADTEQFATAAAANQYARAPRSRVEHLNPIFGAPNSIPWDDTYRNAQAGWDHDAALYARRSEMIWR